MISSHCKYCGRPLSKPSSIQKQCGDVCCPTKGIRGSKQVCRPVKFPFNKDRRPKIQRKLYSLIEKKWQTPRLIFSEDEKKCLMKVNEEIKNVSDHQINIADATETQVEGALFSIFNKDLSDDINECLLKANFDTNDQYKPRKNPIRVMKIQSVAINIRNEKETGADWVLYLQYRLDDKLFEEKMIPIQTKLENKEGMFKTLISGEFGKGLPQSSRLKKLTEESHYLLLSRNIDHFLLPVETVGSLKDKYDKDTFPHSRDYLFTEEQRIGLDEFLLAAIESRVGETENDSVSKVKSYKEKNRIPTFELIFKISSDVSQPEERVGIRSE